MKHPPDPWQIFDDCDYKGRVTGFGYNIINKKGIKVAMCFYQGCDGEDLSMRQAKKNAKLIAAAPVLLNALKDLFADYTELLKTLQQVIENSDDTIDFEKEPHIINAINAIKLAT